MKRSALLALVLAAQLPSPGLGLGLGGCTDGITCANISANNLVFQCRIAAPAPGTSAHRGDVLMLHGFPEWSEMYVKATVRCARHVEQNQPPAPISLYRSPGASPILARCVLLRGHSSRTFAQPSVPSFPQVHGVDAVVGG